MALFHRRADVVLTSVSWERSIDMEHQEWVDRKSQARPIPGDDVRNVRQEKEGYWETVTEWETRTEYVDGQSQTTQEPVSRPEYRTRTVWKYEELDWVPGRTVTASGTSQADVDWPAYTLGGKERTGEQHETYVAVFEEPHAGSRPGRPAKSREAKLDEATWRSLRIGAPYRLELGVLGGIKSVVPAT